MIGIIVVVIFLLFLSHWRLRERVRKLEQKVNTQVAVSAESQRWEGTLRPIPLPMEDINREGELISPAHFTPQGTLASELSPTSNAEPKDWFLLHWFKEHTLIKIGGLIFFLGAGWFVTYAIKAGWLSPELRILLGFLLALVAYGLGVYREHFARVEYLVLTALGTAIISVTVLAAELIFDLLPPLLALSVLAIAIAYTVFVSVKTATLWLAVVSALAGLAAPFFTGITGDSLLIMLYLLVLTVGILLVGIRLEWRILTLVMVNGTLFYESILFNTLPGTTLFTFVIIFSALFLVSVTTSLITSLKPKTIDVVTLLIVSLAYVFFAANLATSASLAVFVATGVMALIGYILFKQGLSSRIVNVYLAFAGAGILIGTSFLFSGYSLVLAYTIELTSAFLLVTYLGFPVQIVWLIAGLYLLPIIGSLASLGSVAWRSGIWHPDALVVYTVLTSLTLSSLWLIHKPGVAIFHSSKMLATYLGVFAFAYSYAVVAVLTESLFLPNDAMAIMYVLWAIISVSLVYYAQKTDLPLGVVKFATWSLLIPTIVSTQSFFASEWLIGIYHNQSFGLFSMVGIFILTILLLTQQFCRDYDGQLKQLIAGMLTLSVAYLFVTLAVVWNSLLVHPLQFVATYVSYAFVLYLLVSLFVLLRTEFRWIKFALSAFVLPVWLSLSSFSLSGWDTGSLAPEAMGLFSLVVIFILLALGLRSRADYLDKISMKLVLVDWSRALLVLSGVYIVGLVWSLAHSIVEPNEAISLALLIYTVAGLGAYLYGKRAKNMDVTYVGIALLSLVVCRLGLVDIWNMELLWRFITCLVIGSLFIGAAFIERKEND